LTSAAQRTAAHRFYEAAGYEVVPHRFMKSLDTDAAATKHAGGAG